MSRDAEPIDAEAERRRLLGAVRSHLEWLALGGVKYVPVRDRRHAEPAAPAEAAAGRRSAAAAVRPGGDSPAFVPHPAEPRPDASAPTAAGAASPRGSHEDAAALVAVPPGAAGLRRIREVLGDCRRCRLSGGRVQLVFGQGNPEADLLFIGEAPGRDEDLSGKAFVGAAGELLTKMIAAMGYDREQVFICNVVKCRPPSNRDPEPEELAACAPFVWAQIQAVSPRVIITLGRVAAQSLLETTEPVGRLRGRFHSLEVAGRRIPLMPTYHPAYLLRNPKAKRPVWEDLKQVIALLREG